MPISFLQRAHRSRDPAIPYHQDPEASESIPLRRHEGTSLHLAN
jgi:hypothetical protein